MRIPGAFAIRSLTPPRKTGAVENSIPNTTSPAVARGQVWYERLTSGEVNSLRAIAEALQVNERYVSRVLRAALLAPDIVEAILEGHQSPQLSVDKLRFGAPLLWAEQRKSFGFDSTSLQHPAPPRS